MQKCGMNKPSKSKAEPLVRNLGEANIQEEILSDGSKVYNVVVPSQTIYCRTQLCAINFVSDFSEAIGRAQ